MPLEHDGGRVTKLSQFSHIMKCDNIVILVLFFTGTETTMPIDFDDMNAGLRRIFISGRLDVPGTDAIATRFAALAAAAARRIVVDLTGVDFLSSIGIRALVANAKAQQQRGGRMVLYVGNNTAVAKTLETTGIDTLIPMFADVSEADKAALA